MGRCSLDYVGMRVREEWPLCKGLLANRFVAL
jgi:hypothetical protein